MFMHMYNDNDSDEGTDIEIVSRREIQSEDELEEDEELEETEEEG